MNIDHLWCPVCQPLNIVKTIRDRRIQRDREDAVHAAWAAALKSDDVRFCEHCGEIHKIEEFEVVPGLTVVTCPNIKFGTQGVQTP